MSVRVSKKGETLVRTCIAELDAKAKDVQRGQAEGVIGPRYVRYKRRHLMHEYDKLAQIARNFGFEV